MSVDRETLTQIAEESRTVDMLDERFDALGRRYSGKVRENFTRDDERIIIVTDRVSAFDVVLGTIPLKGQVLNRMAEYWFGVTEELFENHLLSVPDPQAVKAIECEPIKVEMVARGYLTGVSSTSIWTAYERGDREFCGHALPDGMRKHERLRDNIITPSTKAAKGEHDRSVSKDELFEMGVVEPELFARLEADCLRLFARGQELARERGLILVDTKYELGTTPDGRIVLIDEIHTPDSSRYWYAEGYEASMSAGENPRSLDKEYVRRWLVDQGFRGDGAPPELPLDVRVEAAARYIETYELVSGKNFDADLRPPVERLAAAFGLG